MPTRGLNGRAQTGSFFLSPEAPVDLHSVRSQSRQERSVNELCCESAQIGSFFLSPEAPVDLHSVRSQSRQERSANELCCESAQFFLSFARSAVEAQSRR